MTTEIIRRMADEGITKRDIMAIRPLLRTWIGGGWHDGPQLTKLLLKHEQTLARFKPTGPTKLWRNERIQGPDDGWGHNNHGWEDQYTRATAWSSERYSAETYAQGPGRRLITAVVPPEDIMVCIPIVDYWCRKLGLKPIDEHRQSECIVRPNPSILPHLRPSVSRQEVEGLRKELEQAILAAYLPEREKMVAQGKKVISEEDIRQRVSGAVQNTDPEKLPELVREWRGRSQKVASAFTYSVIAFTYSPKRKWKDYVTVTLDVDKVEASWSQDRDFYVGPRGTGAAIGNRYAHFLQWLDENPDAPIDPPLIGLTPSGTIMFGDGRHRFAVLRDLGEKRVGAQVPREDLKIMEEKFGARPVLEKTARQDQRGTHAFRQWFAGSKIVDALGNPLPVHHGSTRGGISQATAQTAWFTPNKDIATTYSKDDYTGSRGNNPVVQSFYLRILNPLVVDAQGNPWMRIPFEDKTFTTDDLAQLAKRRGHDGLIVRNVEDNVNEEDLGPSDVIATLGGRAQIKSAEANAGSFSREDNSVIAKLASRTLYHGTTIARAKKIMAEGLEPQVGSLVQTAYGDEGDYDFEPLAFAADKSGITRGVYSAMLHAIEAEGHDTTDRAAAIRNWGAIVVLKDGEDQMEHREGDENSAFDYTDHPLQVEPGDYYSRDGLVPDYVITGPALIRFMKRNGGDFNHRGLNPQKVNALIGMAKKVHPDKTPQEIAEKVWSMSPQAFAESMRYYTEKVKELGKVASTSGFNVNDSEFPWTEMILRGEKTVETRNSPSLNAHVGERVGIIRTGKGPATLVGYCTLGKPVVYRTNEEFRADEARHRVPSGSGYDIPPGQVKYGYPISNVEAVDPQPVQAQGRVWRRLASTPHVVYHGMAATDEKAPRRRNGILWTSPDPHVALNYANTYWRKGVPSLWAIRLNPSARIVALWDLENPIIREIKDQVAAERKMSFGVGISDAAWTSYADFGLLETRRWILDALKKARVDAVWVHDTASMGGGEAKDSLALISDRAITSVTRTTPPREALSA